MQLNKEKDYPGLNQESLAQIVAQSFNRRAYTGRKIIQWDGNSKDNLYVQRLASIHTLYHGWKTKTLFFL